MAIDAGRFKDEIVPVVKQRNGQSLVVDTDEQPVPMPAPRAGASGSTFDRLGSVTAGNASSINDGAAAVMMMSEAKAQELNLPYWPIRAFASVGLTLRSWGLRQCTATRRCLERVGWQLADVDLIEANLEAFAAQALSVGKMLEWDERRVNVNGEAIALGHPIGASGPPNSGFAGA
ncbi:hypothetical protein ACNKHK_18255 [Shigella flexneri]